ncbi:MAG TPA: peptidylprolyl isomerase [Candidatus Intestinimonas pullistercoris]|uniref:Peptidylprolyl isomerase n=1 Tax=Candidatus Intestinimonas pullistercoris TaxID=2838623 RepID=A0A9D2NX13_9FIRM|nr:peptidylprolyl isomerase [uncultured Intestinimonas sp.]HJC40007.1 peptidylprolyl isomerase [Candidatus Intestinimonas pullistercoris]
MKHTLSRLGAAGTALALTLSLAACGQDTAGNTPIPLPEEVPADIIQETAGIPRDTVLLTVDGAEVTAEELLYWVCSFADQYAALGMSDLSMDMGDGQTLGDYYLESAIQTATLYQVVENHAQELELGWSEANQTAYDQDVAGMKDSVAQQYGLDPEADAAAVGTEYIRLLSYMGLSEEGFLQVNQPIYLYDNLLTGLYGPEGTEPPDAQGLADAGILHAKHILVRAEPVTAEDGTVTDDGMAAALTEAQGLYDQLMAAEDPAALFDTLMTEHTDDVDSYGNINGGTEGYTFGPGEMVQEFYDGAAALAEGEISAPIQSTYGYHIILRLSADNEAGYEKYAQVRLDEQLDQWMTDAQVERAEALEGLDLPGYYTALGTLRQDIVAAIQEAQAPAETSAPQETTPAESSAPEETAPAESPAA